ncbi:MAG: GNAT family N-acetyltransferase [Anaerolineae bacterium]|nr:GNAT family N-acetyltransferase [Anaerolineae bacterium]
MRPVQITDGEPLKGMCWPDRAPERITGLLQRAQKLAFNRKGVGVVGLDNGTLCGFGMLTLWPRAAEISDLIVHSDHRSRGIGSAIIAYLTQAARRLHAEYIEIGAAESNPRALALYRRLGFIDDRIIKIDLGRGPEPVIYLMKSLTPAQFP